MKKLYPVAIALFLFSFASFVFAREAKLVRYPSYSNGRIAFTYLADIWTADENGQNIQRLTVNKARDAYPRFSPDGKWIAFSSDRNGNLDVLPDARRRRYCKAVDCALSRRHGAWAGRRTAKASSSAASAGKTSWVCFTW